MSIFIIKIIACITMILDHIKYALPDTKCFITQYLGRISFPLFAFLIGEGYAHTSNLKKYYRRLVIFAFISQIPFMLFRTLVGEWKMLNIMFTLLLGLSAITIFDKLGKKYYISIPSVPLVIFLGELLRVDYGWYGVLCVFILYIFRKENKKYLRVIVFALLNIGYYYNRLIADFSKSNLISYIFTTLPVFILLTYNGKLGRKTKYLYYIFYPMHMFLFFMINQISFT